MENLENFLVFRVKPKREKPGSARQDRDRDYHAITSVVRSQARAQRIRSENEPPRPQPRRWAGLDRSAPHARAGTAEDPAVPSRGGVARTRAGRCDGGEPGPGETPARTGGASLSFFREGGYRGIGFGR